MTLSKTLVSSSGQMLRLIILTILLTFQLAQANETEQIKAEITRAMQEKLARDTWRKLVLLKSLNIENLGLEVWVAHPNGGSLESRFGHTFLRIVGSGKTPSEDIIISFIAQTPYDFRYLDGITGAYPVTIQAITLEQTLDQYVVNEGRVVTAIIVPSTNEGRRSLIENLIRMHKEPKNNGHYYFFGRNCTSVLQAILVQNNIISILSETQFPTKIDDVFLTNGVSVFPKRSIMDPKELALRYLDGDNSAELHSQWGHLFFSNKEDDSARLARFHHLASKGDRPLLSSFANRLNPPINLYQRCLHEACIKTTDIALKAVFTQPELDGMCFRLRQWLRPNRLFLLEYNLKKRIPRDEQFKNLDQNLKSMCENRKLYYPVGPTKNSTTN